MDERFPCPVCGYLVFSEPPGCYEICSICFWEDDFVQIAFPDCPGGANSCSLIEAQQNFAQFGACDKQSIQSVSRPTNELRDPRWRPLDLQNDRYLRWGSEQDSQLWNSVKHQWPCPYYWRAEYWLK